MSKHTPGPWVVGYGNGLTGNRASPSCFWDVQEIKAIPISCGDVAVCWLPISGQINEVMEADARLIAAAPELLEALEAMLEVHGVTQAYAEKHIEIPQSWVEVSDLARAAIAKAKGEK